MTTEKHAFMSEISFAQCLKALLAKKKVSASELARMMQYKSRNSIFRILDGEGAHGARLAFFERLKEENPLGLEEADFERLGEALEISRVGAQAYRSNRAMRELMTGGNAKHAQVRVVAPDGGDAQQVLRGMLGAKQMEIVITGCCERDILAALRGQIAAAGVSQRLRVTHFIYAGREELVGAVSAIQPMLYAGFYTAYCVEPGVFSKEREQIYRMNCVCVRWQDAGDARHIQPFVLADRNLFIALPVENWQVYKGLDALFEGDMKKMTALKSVFPYGKDRKDEPDYVAYTDMCRRLEQGRAIYTVKLDVPFPLIDPAILVRCAVESFTAGSVDREKVLKDIEALRVVHAKRFENVFGKHKPTHIILSRAFMERFARTGRQTDHFFALRPYTPDERAAILTHIRDQARDNPNFHVYFFKESFRPPLMEITLYEGAGTMLAKPFTDYNLAGEHAEAVIGNTAFCERYKAFFVEDLLARQVTDETETMEALDALIEMAKEA